jgi:hypothetical protein
MDVALLTLQSFPTDEVDAGVNDAKLDVGGIARNCLDRVDSSWLFHSRCGVSRGARAVCLMIARLTFDYHARPIETPSKGGFAGLQARLSDYTGRVEQARSPDEVLEELHAFTTANLPIIEGKGAKVLCVICELCKGPLGAVPLIMQRPMWSASGGRGDVRVGLHQVSGFVS